MKKHLLIITLVTFFSVGFISNIATGVPIVSVTLATFADPSRNSANPLFTVDFTKMELVGGWSDTQTGLILEIPCSGYTIESSTAFQDAWFEMSMVEITSVNGTFGQTGAGVINFYENGTANTANPLLTISFENGFISRYGLGADEIFQADNVTIISSRIIGEISQEQFAFGFANLAKLRGHTNWNDGFTSTAAFASSAIVNSEVVPEPATICILGLGVLSLIRRSKLA